MLQQSQLLIFLEGTGGGSRGRSGLRMCLQGARVLSAPACVVGTLSPLVRPVRAVCSPPKPIGNVCLCTRWERLGDVVAVGSVCPFCVQCWPALLELGVALFGYQWTVRKYFRCEHCQGIPLLDLTVNTCLLPLLRASICVSHRKPKCYRKKCW